MSLELEQANIRVCFEMDRLVASTLPANETVGVFDFTAVKTRAAQFPPYLCLLFLDLLYRTTEPPNLLGLLA